MLPQDILPAIPRQKVKHKFGGFAHVLNLGMDERKIAVMTINPARLEEWNVEDCEIVPEEPRGFRVGDKVKCKNVFTTISEISTFDDGNNVYVLANGGQAEAKDLRHATPEEVAKYFN